MSVITYKRGDKTALTKNFSRYEFDCPCGCGTQMVDPELAEKLQREIMRMIQSRKPCYQKRWVEFKSGGMEIYQWVVPFYSETGRLEGLVGGWFDKSEAKKWDQ